MRIDSIYGFGDEVYLKSDPDQTLRVVIGIVVKPGNQVLYELACGSESSDHYEFEITTEKSYKT